MQDSGDSEDSEEGFGDREGIRGEEAQFVGSTSPGPDAPQVETPGIRDPTQEQLREASPEHREVSPDHREASPEHRVVMPDDRKASPDLREASPDFRDASPDQREASPDHREATPDRLSDHRPSCAEPVSAGC